MNHWLGYASFAIAMWGVVGLLTRQFIGHFSRTFNIFLWLDLNSSVWLLKNLGAQQRAAELIDCYVDKHKESATDLFDLSIYPFRERIDDPDVIKTFEAVYAIRKEQQPESIEATIQSMITYTGWSPEHIITLSTASVDDYYRLLKNAQGGNLHKIIDTLLQFDRISPSSTAMEEITNKAKAALMRIGEESTINALRVRRYGIDVDPERISSTQ